MEHPSYTGLERRRHRMYVTRNTEYHFRDQTCVAVRDRRTGQWLPSHLALNRTLSGGVRYTKGGTLLPSLAEPQVGDALYFGDQGPELVTSQLSAIDRPDRTMVSRYPDLCVGIDG
jgi:hypothetical protein